MNDQDKAKAIEKANSYLQMMGSWAWKDFEACLDRIRQDSLEHTVWASTMEDVQLQRGFVKCVDAIKAELGYVLGNGASND